MSIKHEALEKAKVRMEKALAALKTEFGAIRAGRANPQLLNRIMVSYYGVMTPIPQVGNVSSPEPRMLTISLWDAGMLKEVEKAILASDLGITPTNDGKVIRLVFPEPTAERRVELVKQAKKKTEEAKVAVRNIRRDTIEVLRKEKKDSAITEDDMKTLEKDCQEMTDDFNEMIETTFVEKEKEILEF
jgi:ribosome recycling factor